MSANATTAPTPASSSPMGSIGEGPEPFPAASVVVGGSDPAAVVLVAPATTDEPLGEADAAMDAEAPAEAVAAAALTTCQVPPKATTPSPFVWPAAVSWMK